MAEQETIFGKWAKERGIMESEMKEIISERIRQGMNDPDPENRLSGEQYLVLVKCQHQKNGSNM